MATKDKVPLSTLVAKLQGIREHLSHTVYERETEINGIILAILSKTSCFFYGDVGTAKTFLIRSVSELFGLSAFDILLSETTKPDAIFGPTDVPALARGIQRTKITGYAPDSEILFFDEIFKANATVLNPLLWLINEHEYRNGDDGIIKCPVRATFAASNEIPDDDALRAVYDRLLLRYEIRYIKNRDNLRRMVESHLTRPERPEPVRLTPAELDRLTRAVTKVTVSPELMNQVFKIRDQIRAATGVTISDRRVARSFRILQASALMNARTSIEASDLEVLSHLFWDMPENYAKVSGIVMANLDNGVADLMSLGMLANDVWETGLKEANFDDVVKKLETLYSKVERFRTGRGFQIAEDIRDKLVRARELRENRKQFELIRMRLSTGTEYKVSAATALLWNAKELRSVDFHFRRVGEYWYHYGPTGKLVRKKFERKLKEKILKGLGAVVTIKKI